MHKSGIRSIQIKEKSIYYSCSVNYINYAQCPWHFMGLKHKYRKESMILGRYSYKVKMDKEKILKNSRRRSNVFMILYVLVLLMSIILFVFVANNIKIDSDINLMQYILRGGM